jgi:hypothetical protein
LESDVFAALSSLVKTRVETLETQADKAIKAQVALRAKIGELESAAVSGPGTGHGMPALTVDAIAEMTAEQLTAASDLSTTEELRAAAEAREAELRAQQEAAASSGPELPPGTRAFGNIVKRGTIVVGKIVDGKYVPKE